MVPFLCSGGSIVIPETIPQVCHAEGIEQENEKKRKKMAERPSYS